MELAAPPSVSLAARRTELYLSVLDAVQAVPGVRSAGIIGDLFSANPESTSSRSNATTARPPSACG
jgi:hypothetical protein